MNLNKFLSIKLYKKISNLLETKNRNKFEFFLILELLTKKNANSIKQKLINDELKISKSTLFKLFIFYISLLLNYPWEYIFHNCIFNTNWYYIKKPVFIPRHCTETIIDIVKQLEKGENLIEFGCGSGALLVEIQKTLKFTNIYGVDILNDAVQTSIINCKKFKNIKIIKNNWTENIKNEINIENIDVIISNPPYVNNVDSTNKGESKIAIYGNKKSTIFYYLEIIKYSKKLKNEKINIIFEIPVNFIQKVKNYCKKLKLNFIFTVHETYEKNIKILLLIIKKY